MSAYICICHLQRRNIKINLNTDPFKIKYSKSTSYVCNWQIFDGGVVHKMFLKIALGKIRKNRRLLEFLTNLEVKGAKRCVNKWAQIFFLYVNAESSEIRSLRDELLIWTDLLGTLKIIEHTNYYKISSRKSNMPSSILR